MLLRPKVVTQQRATADAVTTYGARKEAHLIKMDRLIMYDRIYNKLASDEFQ